MTPHALRAVIVDDEPLARSRLRRLLGDHADVVVVAEAATAEEAVAAVLAEHPDVLFLDVNMPGRTGLEALADVQERLPEGLRPHAVFTTAHEEHAVPAFALEGTDYLLKPIEREHLARALRRVRRAMALRSHPRGAVVAPSTPAVVAAAAPGLAGHLMARHAGRVVPVPVADLAALTVEDELTWAHSREGRFHVPESLAVASAGLPSPPFSQVSRSAVLNVSWIATLSPAASGTWRAVLKPPFRLEIPVSRRRARELLGR